MSVFIPPKATKKYSSSLNGDLFGNLVRSRNLDFNKKGYLSLAGKPLVFYTETQDADFETPIFIASNDSVYYVGTSDRLFSLSIADAGIGATERHGGSPPNFGFHSDFAFFTADMHVSGTTTVCSLNGSTWTSRISSNITTGQPHPMCVSEHQGYLAVGNGNAVRLFDSSYTLITTCTIPAAQIVTWIRWRANMLYFGTRNIYGGEAKVYLWNGSGTAANAAYGIGSSWAMSGCEYEDTIVVAGQDGRLLRYVGNGFVPLRTDDGREMAFPVYYSGLPWGSSASASSVMANVANRGMVAKGRRIFIFVDATLGFDAGGTPDEMINFPGGLWVFDPEIGLYHKAGVCHTQAPLVVISSVAANVITLASAQVFETGDPVYMDTVVSLTGDIDSNMIYYAIKVDSTHLKLAATAAQAAAGVNITITGTPTGEEILFNTYKSVGATRVGRSGPVHLITDIGLPRFNGSEVLFASEVNNNTGTTIGAVMSPGMGKNVGSFITPKIQAENVTDVFKKLISKFPVLSHPSRKIIFKYRIGNRFGAPGRRDFRGGAAIWINSNSFTINPKTYDVYALAIGDEIEFTQGAAAGYTAHVSAITVNSVTDWTITLDESMPDVAASDSSDFLWDNWTKYKTVSTADAAKEAAMGFANFALTKKAKWAQLKVELRGFPDIDDSMDLEEVMLLAGADQKYA